MKYLSRIQPLSNQRAGELIDAFLQTQGGKVLTLHRLADHLLGRTQVVDNTDIKELENVLEEERRREGGVVHIQPDDNVDIDDGEEEAPAQSNLVPDIKHDKQRARKEERRMKKEKEKQKRKREEDHRVEENEEKSVQSTKKVKKNTSHDAKKK